MSEYAENTAENLPAPTHTPSSSPQLVALRRVSSNTFRHIVWGELQFENDTDLWPIDPEFHVEGDSPRSRLKLAGTASRLPLWFVFCVVVWSLSTTVFVVQWQLRHFDMGIEQLSVPVAGVVR